MWKHNMNVSKKLNVTPLPLLNVKMNMEPNPMTKSITTFFGVLMMTSCTVDYELTGARPDVNPGDVTECPFTAIEGTNILAYDCNPVFTSTDEDWGGDGSVGFYATDVMGHPFYQMWYTSSNSDQFGNFGMDMLFLPMERIGTRT